MACKILDSSGNEDDGTLVDGKGDIVMELIAQKRRKLDKPKSTYMNADFIMGSIAKVERSWSLVRRVLLDCRKKCTPLFTKPLMFFKMNATY